MKNPEEIDTTQYDQFEFGSVGSVEVNAAATTSIVPTPVGNSSGSGNHKHVIWGDNDNQPDDLIRLAEGSFAMPGILEFWEGMLFGDGIGLYETAWNEKTKKREVREVMDEEIQEWIHASQLEYCLLDMLPDYVLTGNAFGQYLFNRGSSTVKKKKIVSFRHTDVNDCRFTPLVKGKVRKIMVGSFGNLSVEDDHDVRIDPRPIELFDPDNDEQVKPNTERLAFFVRRKKAGRKYYSRPKWYSQETEKVLGMTMQMLDFQDADLKNGMNARYMVLIYKDYFKELYPEPEYDEQYRKGKKEELAMQVHKKLSGSGNSGKNMWADFRFSESGEALAGVIIKKIETNINDDAYSKLLDQYTAILAMANNVHPGLADMIIQGKIGSDTGSAVRETYNVMERTKTKIDRMLLLRPYNEAMWFNFPDRKRYFLDFKRFTLVTTDKDKTGVKPEPPIKTEQPAGEPPGDA